MKFVPVNSQILQRKEGYRRLLSLYSLLQLATHCDFLETDFQNLIETKDVPTLYEYWCFFQIKTVMDTFSTIKKVSPIINTTALFTELSAGLCIEYHGGIKLLFNNTYSGSTEFNLTTGESPDNTAGDSYSHNLRPDIVIEQQGRKLIFDAKYKGKSGRSEFYGEEDDGTIKRWKDEDIDKMHCYHDAIHGVVGSFILFPGTRNAVYTIHGSNVLCEGVGALALRPGGDGGNCITKSCEIRRIITAFLK